MFLLLFLALFGETLAVPTKMGYKDWVTYQIGKDSVILSAPHGGWLNPTTLPKRHNGCLNATSSVCIYKQGCTEQTKKCKVTTVMDFGTLELTNLIADDLRRRGIRPHVITANVSRRYIDLNRDIISACFGNAECEKVYKSYHGFIETAISSMNGYGLFIEIHGQKHAANWTELGYRISKAELNSGNFSNVRSSINHLFLRSGYSLTELLTGRVSMGHYLSSLGYRVVPSGSIPKPGNGGYYRGGYNTLQYGSVLEGRCMDAIQFEMPKGLRFADEKGRKKTAADFATAIQQFYETHNFGDTSIRCSSAHYLDSKNVVMLMIILATYIIGK